MTKDELINWLRVTDENALKTLQEKAHETLMNSCGPGVSLRGLIEFSNVCRLDCFYCGIRRSMQTIKRYTLKASEIIFLAKQAAKRRYGSLVLQSGERSNDSFIDFVSDLIVEIKRETKSSTLPNGLGITLSCGEQTDATYKKWFDAGAHRYLLRIETSSKELFRALHPEKQSFDQRVQCLKNIRNIGYQLGSGVMIGLPGQSEEHLADDILFLESIGVDMVGMGPYIPMQNTPLFHQKILPDKERLLLGLKMIALLRLKMKNINIAATTALQTLSPNGRALGLKFGANVVMIQMTPPNLAQHYALYQNKPITDEDSVLTEISKMNRTLLYDEYGDSRSFK